MFIFKSFDHGVNGRFGEDLRIDHGLVHVVVDNKVVGLPNNLETVRDHLGQRSDRDRRRRSNGPVRKDRRFDKRRLDDGAVGGRLLHVDSRFLIFVAEWTTRNCRRGGNPNEQYEEERSKNQFHGIHTTVSRKVNDKSMGIRCRLS